ncbi:rimK-like ATP-grasp domain protein [Vibrio cholerae HC-80A1]|nr:glutathione synthase/Ribosomal protein S6 modification enzyme (glutaminyl transferase) [Vibrio cholerae CIRS101]EGR02746.1 rimK-like ATP-grasp domain protein [Vibrio cholerae HCUF01]EHI01764.1 rimK-like ATP-grasp domain protein [Vibrio cholerae HC-33A2]EHI05924.1 rimK-like ATP-grasp domain protein [Vibrio cholerae HC-61A1]EJH34573.1 rimK-like ATP-grasp domain protein [Vibrio cholerae CP1038(11)]EJH40690.1 rimK-like ATP-grasp domain protein [Vibrio cholerae CP1042(15)]EJH47613.1 rimK-like A
MNKRNHAYIGRYNDRSKYPLVDDKLKTKLIAQRAGCTVPKLIGVISNQAEVKHIHEMVKDWPGFVIKPARGSGGKGILVVTSHQAGVYTKPSGSNMNKEDVERHISNALAGLFSLGGKNDVAVVENLIQFDDCFEGFSYEGVPDVRIIVFKGYPVMAMMRLSTSASDGKANLHQGAVGVGIDIATGKAVRAVQFNKPVTHHPDTDKELATLVVPHWERLLTLAASAWEMTGLGYLGTDMVLDKEEGPMVLELNARPGLAIQIANGAGLLPRLQHIESLGSSLIYPTPAERVAYAVRKFGVHSPIAQ